MHRAPGFILASIQVIFFSLIVTMGHAAVGTFPQFEAVRPNVSFWTKVYTQYSTSQAIVHDSSNLDIIYAVIDIKPYDAPGSRKINRKRLKRAKKNYQDILKRLARDPNTADPDCRRVAALFSPQAKAKHFGRARKNVRCQIGQKDRFRAGLIRSGAYIGQIRSIFKSHGLPDELAYLPHVESSFNLKAYSKFGAAGIWQFTRSTGKRFLTVGYVLDERRDPIRATYAAAELLKENYKKLGSWPLAITAYNHGAAGMARAKKIHGGYENIFRSYTSRTFKFASRNFYSEFLAARQIAMAYQNYFGQLTMDKPVTTHTVPLKGHLALKDVCNHFQVTKQVLKEMNPALREPVFNGQKYLPRGYVLHLPLDPGKSQTSMIASISESLYKKAQKPSRFYTVHRGDTAGKVARMHAVNLTDLILANNLNRRATIYPRQTLRIPVPGELKSLKTIRKPAEKAPQTLIAAKSTPAKTENKPEPGPVVYPSPVLASIIPLSDASISTKAATVQEASNAEIVTAEVSLEKIYNIKGRSVAIIRVEMEETLGHYAEWAQVRTQHIRRLNGLKYGQVLNLHQKIKIPLSHTQPQAFEENRYEYHKRLQEDFFAAYRIGDLQPYRVRRGDNIWTLCRDKFDIPMWLLKHSNPEVDFADLRLRQKLLIPNIDKITAADPDITPSTDSLEIDSETGQEGDELEHVNL